MKFKPNGYRLGIKTLSRMSEIFYQPTVDYITYVLNAAEGLEILT